MPAAAEARPAEEAAQIAALEAAIADLKLKLQAAADAGAERAALEQRLHELQKGSGR